MMHINAYVRLLRPTQWVKNIFVFVPLVFSKGLFELEVFFFSLAAGIIFCGLASAVYIFNDLCDLEEDKRHPQKRFRPLPQGIISPFHAQIFFLCLAAGSLVASFFVSRTFGSIAMVYLLLNIFYSVFLKRIVIIDVMVVAANYVIRVLAGAVAIQVMITPWLLIVSTLLALFLVLGKRRHELVLLGDGASEHRSSLREYTPYFLDQLIGIVTASTVVVYCLYTMDPKVSALLGTHLLPLTIPFVLFGIFRYLYLMHQKKSGGNPTELFLNDKPLILDVILWVFAFILIIYL